MSKRQSCYNHKFFMRNREKIRARLKQFVPAFLVGECDKEEVGEEGLVELALDPQSLKELELMKAMGLPIDIAGTAKKSKVEISIKSQRRRKTKAKQKSNFVSETSSATNLSVDGQHQIFLGI